LFDEARAVTEQAKPTRAIATYLEEQGSISNHMAIYQPGIVTKRLEPATEMMCADAGFHAN